MSARHIRAGFRFGMLLQLAVGPVCVFIFQTASAGGFSMAMAGVAGVVLVDAAYIAAAILGVAAFMGKKGVKAAMNWFGAAVLCIFGVCTVLSQFGVNLLPGLTLGGGGSGGAFPRALLLTASNPLTILFWAGVFTSKVSQSGMARKDVWLFGLGTVASTAAFMAAVAAVGSLVKAFLPEIAMQILNIAVGAALVFFGVKMAIGPSTKKKGAD